MSQVPCYLESNTDQIVPHPRCIKYFKKVFIKVSPLNTPYQLQSSQQTAKNIFKRKNKNEDGK